MLNVKRWQVDCMIQIFHSFSKFPEKNCVFLHEDTGHSRHVEKNTQHRGERHKMLKCCSTGAVAVSVPSACSQTKGGKAACTCDPSGHVFTWPWNAKSCTRWFSCCTQEIHGLLGSLMDALEKVKKAPLSIYCTLGWFPRAVKIQASVKTGCCERESLWQKYSCDL